MSIVVYCYLSTVRQLSMKFQLGKLVIALVGAGFASAQQIDWTCEDCESELQIFNDHAKSPRGIAFAEPYLYREVCTRPEFHTNECDKAVSDWWPRIADVLYSGPPQYACDRLTGRNCSQPNPTQPEEIKLRDLSTCDVCLRLMARVASFYDHPDIIAEALDVMSVKTEQPIPILELMLETQQL